MVLLYMEMIRPIGTVNETPGCVSYGEVLMIRWTTVWNGEFALCSESI